MLVSVLLFAVSACTSNPCQNNGFCLDADSGVDVYCICPEGFTGSACETKGTTYLCLSLCFNLISNSYVTGEGYCMIYFHFKGTFPIPQNGRL